jgi:aspartate-semialdehyde dehydrogenase
MQPKGKKIPVAVLGATGMVGQKFIELLQEHPWFEIVALAASERSEGQRYGQAVQWRMATPLLPSIAEMKLQSCTPHIAGDIAFSALDSSVAGEIESTFAKGGFIVISNSRNHRMHSDVPLLIPEVNPEHLELVHAQKYGSGMIITNPNCVVCGLVMALHPLAQRWGIDTVQVTTMQAVSGAGYPGVASFDIIDNVIPYIASEEEKVESEPLKILGSFQKTYIEPYQMVISAQCNRVPVMDGHMGCVSVKLKEKASPADIIDAWTTFQGLPQTLKLPSAPSFPLLYMDGLNHPQPKLHRLSEKGMSVSIGRLRPCPVLDWKFTLLSHNTIRGAAGCAILNAELITIMKPS